MERKNRNNDNTGLSRVWSILVGIGLVAAGCASSGDVEQVRQEREQAKAKMSAELQQERKLVQSMEQESEARKAEADKLAKALGGKSPGPLGGPLKGAGSSITLSQAVTNYNNGQCQLTIPANPPVVPQAVTALHIASGTPCNAVTVGTSDATFTAQAPLMPVIVGSGGTLTLQDQAMTLYASSFLIRNGGAMQAGSVTAPIQSQITIVMAGNVSAALPPTAGDQNPNARDLTVMDGGTLALYGGKGLSARPDGTQNNPLRNPIFINTVFGTKSWTYLSVPAGPAKYNDAENVSAPVPATNPDTTLTLAMQVDWQVNDWVAVATTSFTSHQTEIVQICSIAAVANPEASAKTPIPGTPAQVSQLTLCSGTKLKHYHYGGLAPTPGLFPAKTKQVVVPGGNAIDVSRQAKSFYDDHHRNYGIDERAEVALLSRNIKLTSAAGQTTDANNFIGGHVVTMVSGTTSPTLTLVGVEIEKFGQALVGRYPVHLHKLPSGTNVLMQDVSVHHSYNKCYVVHATGNANFYNNVCVRTVGQGVYLEDGTGITGNQFMRNLIAGTMAANSTYSYPRQNGSTYWDGDNLQRSYSSATWYATSGIPDTSFSGANAVCPGGSCMPGPDLFHPGGFWITNLGNTFVNNSVAGCQAQGRAYWLLTQNNQRFAYPEFTGNRSHGCYNGIDTNADTVMALNPQPFLPSSSYPVTGVTIPPITITSPTPLPSGTQTVTIAGTNIQAGTWPVTNINNSRQPYTFGIKNAIVTGTYSGSGGTWQLPAYPVFTATKVTNQPIVITVPGGIPAPPTNTQVTITGTGTAADNTWTVTNTGTSTFSLNNSTSSSSAGFPVTNAGTWQLQAQSITGVALPPIVVTTTSTPPSTGTQVAISGTGTSADSTWFVTTPAVGYGSGTFSLNGSTGTGTYGGSGGTWHVARQAPVLLLNDNTVTRSRFRGVWIRTIYTALHNNRLATNPYGFSLLGGGGPEGNPPGYWGLAHENVIAGMTRNNVERYPAGCAFPITSAASTAGPAPNYLVVTSPVIPTPNAQIQISGVQGYTSANGGWTVGKTTTTTFQTTGAVNAGSSSGSGMWQYAGSNAPSWPTECTDVQLSSGLSGWGNFPTPNFQAAMNIQGYSYYDGPARIEHNRFVNFRFDPTGIHPNNPAARLLTKTDIQTIAAFDTVQNANPPLGTLGQLQGAPQLNGTVTTLFNGYVGDAATGWIQSNQQTVPPTQYIQNSIWDNVDFKHQVYTEAVNLGPFNDGDKTTVILDKDGQLSGLRVVDGSGTSHHDLVPVSLNSVDYYATEYTVDEPHSRGPNDFRATSLMSPHKYATLNIESVDNPPGGIPATFRVEIKRDMPAYGDTVYPYLFLNGRGQNPIYEPFVMDRMGYTVYGKTGTEHQTTTPAAFQNRLLFSYTDPAVKKAGDFFVNRIAIYQQVTDPTKINVSRIRRQWGEPYDNPLVWPPGYIPPGGTSTSCDSAFFAWQAYAEPRWQDCLARANNQAPPAPWPGGPTQYSGGMTLPQATSWQQFEQPYKTLMGITKPTAADIATFIAAQTYYYDAANNMLYFYMIEEKPVQRQYSPFGTCDAANYNTGVNYLAQIQQIKSFSDPSGVQAALDASCLVAQKTPQPTDLFACHETGCAAYLVNFTNATVGTPPSCSPCVPPHPIARTDYSAWNQYHFVYATPLQQPNGLPVPTTAPQDGTALPAFLAPVDGTPPPAGDQVTYSFLTIPGPRVPVTENFRYHCVTNPPWSPVNPRGAYPPSGGFTYPLSPSVCMTAAQGTAVMETGVVLQVVVTNPGSGYTSPPTVTITPPASGMQAQGVATIANGSVTGVTMTNQGSGYNFGPQVTFSPPAQ